MMKKLIIELVPELEKHLVPACETYGWCPENAKRSCNKYPQKETVLKLIQEHRKTIQKKG